ncbi:MAG TPA: adenylate/guanylate cyclase domain-containing protein [Gaiellaceae bacterium]|nr:adenylate/guanylate cyclase domain-containing protein [Gaiellaceae bacterium]
MQTCTSCGFENAESAKFCSECGTALTTPTARREERKVVTVVFADLVGSTARAERLDPEDVRAILAPYHERLRDELERRGGTVEKFIGDAVVGVFGAPVAHEDDQERAVRAALAIQEAIAELNDADPRLELEVRIGVHTGEALVNVGARPELGEAMVAGDVVNTGSRLQAAAPPGGILVGEQTFWATERVIEYREVEPVTAKGKAEPIPAWQAIQARSRYGIDLARPGGAKLIGRERELDVLADALARARADRTPELVTLVGVPGIGKSRLVWELFGLIEQIPDLIYWRQGRCLPYGDGITFWALGEMAKAHTGVLESDSSAEAEEKLHRTTADLLPDERESHWVEGHLRPLVGLATQGEGSDENRYEAFAAWRRFFEAIAEERPLILVFEDMQWADDGLLDFVDSLSERVSGVPLLVLCSTRPELLERRPGWGGGKRNAVTVSLEPLSDDETARLIAALLDRPVLPAETQTALVQRAGGNPLYAEEYVRMLGDRGEGDLPLPETVQGIVAARLDLLGDAEKALLQHAAVLGKVFWTDALVSLAILERRELEDRLHALERKEFISRERRSAVAGEAQYAFRHVLVRDVAYGQMPRAARADGHRHAAEWIESLPPDRSEDRSEMLAHHYLAALEYSRSAGRQPGDLVARASVALQEAGDRAIALNAFAAAVRYYSSASELGELDARRLLAFGRALGLSESRGDDVLASAAEAALANEDMETAAEAEMLRGELRILQGERDDALAHIDRAAELVADAPLSASKAFVTSNISRFLMLAGRNEEAIRIGGDALAMAEELGLDELRAHALNNIGAAKAAKGDLSGLDDLRRSIDIASELNSPEARRGLNNLATNLRTLGDLTAAEPLFHEALSVAERFGIVTDVLWCRVELASIAAQTGRWDEAAAAVDAAIAEFAQRAPHYMEGPCRYDRARIRLGRGDIEGAVDDALTSVELAERVRDPQVLYWARAGAARIFHAAGRTPEAEVQVNRLLADVNTEQVQQPAHFWVLDLAVAMAAAGRGVEFVERLPTLGPPTRWAEAAELWARDAFERAADLLEEIGARPDEALARLRAAETLVAAGRRTEADEQLGRALGFFRSVGATRYIREGERLLAASA